MTEYRLDEASLRAFDPQWCLFWGDGIAASQLETWLPYLRRSRYRFLVVSSIDKANERVWPMLEDLPNCRVGMPYADVRRWLKGSKHFKGVLYTTTRSPNFDMVTAFPRLAHAWVGHGESEKGVNGPRTASLYDAVFMARYRAANRFPRAIRPFVRSGACAIGTPIVEGVVKDPWTGPRPVRTVIYAPTWEGMHDAADYSSVPDAVPVLLAALPALRERGITLIVRSHPGMGKRLPEYRAQVKALIAAGAQAAGPKADDFAAADVMISDVSGVTGEFLFTEKPGIMPVTSRSVARGKDAKTIGDEYPWVYRWDVARDDLVAMLDGLAREDPLRGRRRSSARDMFRGHRSLDEATRTFDTALSVLRFRKTRIPVWITFETRLRIGPLLRIPLVRGVLRRVRPR